MMRWKHTPPAFADESRILTEGQKDCEALGFVRLPPALARRAVEAVRKIE